MGETNHFRATSVLCFLALILNIKFELGACFSSTPRQIQENNGYKYTIDKPTFDWDGFRLNIDYKFSGNLIEEEFVTYAIVSDKDCEGGIISDTELQSSLIEFSRNSVRLSLLFDPETIHGARYVSHYEEFAIIGVCARVWINQPLSTSEIEGETILSAPRNDYIMIQADLEDLKGITDILDDRTLDWGVDVFRCNDNNKEIVSPPAIANGEKLRLCLKPTTTTRNGNGYIGLIKSFQFARDGDFQKAVATYGTDDVTDVDCPPGSTLCVIETVLSNDFFHSPGEVTATGVIALQYGIEENRKHRLLRSVQVNLRSSINKRSLNAFQNGELVSEKPVEYVVNIKPTNILYSAEAYPCDNRNKITRKTSLKQGEHMKLCIEPDSEARDAGVYITSIESFSYGRANDDKNQQAIDSYGRVSDGNRTQVECAIGAAKCSINSTLEEWFFDQDARMVVTGYAVLQFGDQTQRRRANIVQRDLAELGYAGRSQVDAFFDIIGRNTVIEEKGGLRQWFDDLFDRWELSDDTMTILFIVAAVLFVLICLCCFAGCLFLLFLRKEKRQPKERTQLPINIKILERDYSSSTDLRESNSRADDYSSDDSDSSDDSESTDIEDSIRGGPTAIVKRERKNKKKSFEDEIESTSGGDSEDDDSSVLKDLVEGNNNISTDSAIPEEDDVCFEAEEHPGTVAFVEAVQETLVNLGPIPYSPAVYKNIKRQLPDRRFYVCDRDNDDNNGEIDDHYEWREASKRELIDVFWKNYELEKLKGLEL